MSLILSGTDGLSDVDGSAATPAIRGSDTNTGIFFPAADTIAFSEGGVESMRLDSSGNVGIGTSSPVTKLFVYDSSRTSTTPFANIITSFRSNGTNADSTIQFSDNVTNAVQLGLVGGSNGALGFATAGAERARIANTGDVLIGTTSTAGTAATLTYLRKGGITWQVGPTAGTGNYAVLNSGDVGVFVANGNTSWSANSDERLKTALTPFDNAVEKVCSLRAGTGRYLKDDESVSRSFLIAQDVQKVLPEAVNVQNDEQGTLALAYTDLIPLLTAAIQELKAEVDALKAQLGAQA